MTTPPTFKNQVDALIENHSSDPQLLGVICHHFGLSSSQIYRRIKQHTGLSPSRYIRKVRLAMAMELIRQSDLTLTEIAQRVGFQQLPYFSRCFSKEFGYAASSLRRRGGREMMNDE